MSAAVVAQMAHEEAMSLHTWNREFDYQYYLSRGVAQDARAYEREKAAAKGGPNPVRDALREVFANSKGVSNDDGRLLDRIEPKWMREMLWDKFLVKERVTKGKRFDPMLINGKYIVPAITVDGHLRSETSTMCRLLVAYTPKKVKSGRNKDVVTESPRRVKALALDDPYIVINEKMVGGLRVDLDKEFASAEVLLAEIAALGVQKPNFIVGHVNKHTGRLVHPHLIWLLRDPVCFTDNGRLKCRRYYVRTLRNLTMALKSLGADEGAMSNCTRIKNPLSPQWTTADACDTAYSLVELNAGIPDCQTTATEKTKSAIANFDLDAFIASPESNKLWTAFKSFAWRNAYGFKVADDYAGFEQRMAEFGQLIADACAVRIASVRKALEKVVSYTWAHFDVTKWGKRKGAGQGAVVARPVGRPKSAEPKQRGTTGRSRAENGAAVCAERRQNTVARIAAVIGSLVRDGAEKLTNTLIATTTGISTKTVQRYREAAEIAALATGHLVVGNPPPMSKMEVDSRDGDENLYHDSSHMGMATDEPRQSQVTLSAMTTESSEIGFRQVEAESSQVSAPHDELTSVRVQEPAVTSKPRRKAFGWLNLNSKVTMANQNTMPSMTRETFQDVQSHQVAISVGSQFSRLLSEHSKAAWTIVEDLFDFFTGQRPTGDVQTVVVQLEHALNEPDSTLGLIAQEVLHHLNAEQDNEVSNPLSRVA